MYDFIGCLVVNRHLKSIRSLNVDVNYVFIISVQTTDEDNEKWAMSNNGFTFIVATYIINIIIPGLF